MKLVHISDIHFSKISFAIGNLFSKRILGTCNLLLKRKRAFQQEYLFSLLSFFDSEKIDALIITGDLTSTSLDEEFLLARTFLQEIQKRNMRLFLLPGNHDVYTKESFEKKSFYRFFAPFCDLSALCKEGISSTALDEKWQILCLDCAIATSLFSSRGHFSSILEEKLDAILQPLRDRFILIAQHFPFSDKISRRKILERNDPLKKILRKYPQVKIYLHGHTHISSCEDLRYQHLPISIGAGSVTKKKGAYFNLLETTPSGCTLSTFRCVGEGWKMQKKNQLFF